MGTMPEVTRGRGGWLLKKKVMFPTPNSSSELLSSYKVGHTLVNMYEYN